VSTPAVQRVSIEVPEVGHLAPHESTVERYAVAAAQIEGGRGGWGSNMRAALSAVLYRVALALPQGDEPARGAAVPVPTDDEDEAARIAWRLADVTGWPKWMQVPALGNDITPVVRRVIEAVDAHRASEGRRSS
jgi:hypothetical protein